MLLYILMVVRSLHKIDHLAILVLELYRNDADYAGLFHSHLTRLRINSESNSESRLRGCLKSPLVGIEYFLPHPNPPLIKGREPHFLVSPLSKGGLRGVIIPLKSQPTTFQTPSKDD
jgi:hypothetical protein